MARGRYAPVQQPSTTPAQEWMYVGFGMILAATVGFVLFVVALNFLPRRI